MTDTQIATLTEAVKAATVVFMHPHDDNAVFIVERIGEHSEEGKGYPCAIFRGGKYAALDNCHGGEFHTLTPLDYTL